MLNKITPSQINPWIGTPIEGARYTAEQARVMVEERPRWSRFEDKMVVLRFERPGIWEPEPPPVTVPCPIIAWSKDRTRVLIITLGGFKQWADASREFIDRQQPKCGNRA